MADATESDRQAIAAVADALRIRIVRPLVVNRWKRTATLLGQAADGTQVVLKWRPSDASPAVLDWFSNERDRYRAGVPGGHAATVLATGADHLVLAWAPGRSVLDALEAFIVDSDDAEAGAVASVTTMWLDALVPTYAELLGGEPVVRLDARLAGRVDGMVRSLARSGPMRTTRQPLTAAIGYSLESLTRPSLRRLLQRHLALGTMGWAHGDLHLDNLWLADDGRVLLLDLATADPAGYPALDLVYALAATRSRLSGHDATLRATLQAAAEALRPLGAVGDDIFAFAADLAVVGSTNPRFAPDEPPIRRSWGRLSAPIRLGIRATRR